MLKQFQDKKRPSAAMQAVLSTRDQLDTTMKSVTFDSKTTETWSHVNSELDAMSKAFHMDPPSAKEIVSPWKQPFPWAFSLIPHYLRP